VNGHHVLTSLSMAKEPLISTGPDAHRAPES
jgi:hypothetical protein